MKSPPYTKPVESKKPDTRTEHEKDVDAMYPPVPDTDAHNDKVINDIGVMLELVTRNQELKERVRELEANNEKLHAGATRLLCLLEDLDGCTAKQAEYKIEQCITELVEALKGE